MDYCSLPGGRVVSRSGCLLEQLWRLPGNGNIVPSDLFGVIMSNLLPVHP
jgi:hypothetical protein